MIPPVGSRWRWNTIDPTGIYEVVVVGWTNLRIPDWEPLYSGGWVVTRVTKSDLAGHYPVGEEELCPPAVFDDAGMVTRLED